MDFQITIIGAGVVGLAIAAQVSRDYSDILMIEKHPKFGQETSSRNSEVIHSGVYYPNNSLKATLCVEGKELLYNYCNEKNINYNKCGKLIVAIDNEEAQQLSAILMNSRKNGVKDGKIIDTDEIAKIEPHIMAIAAIQYPSTGIIDSHGLMKQLEADSMLNGTQIAYRNKVTDLSKINNGFKVVVEDDTSSSFEFTSEVVINSAGLNSFEISSMIGLNNRNYKLHYWKGEYFRIGNGKNKLINTLVYPVPNSNITGLGIHATIDLNNNVKLGPSSIYLSDNNIDYRVDENNQLAFYNSAKRFLPFLELNDLYPDQAGIRPKLQKPGDPVSDFIIRNEVEAGFPNFINLIGIESPGLTSCLSIAKYVENLILRVK